MTCQALQVHSTLGQVSPANSPWQGDLSAKSLFWRWFQEVSQGMETVKHIALWRPVGFSPADKFWEGVENMIQNCPKWMERKFRCLNVNVHALPVEGCFTGYTHFSSISGLPDPWVKHPSAATEVFSVRVAGVCSKKSSEWKDGKCWGNTGRAPTVCYMQILWIFFQAMFSPFPRGHCDFQTQVHKQ